jgi:competence protein ComFC
MRYALYRWSWAALDWLFPPNCGGCNKPGDRWCSNCRENVLPIKPPICELCGQTSEGDKYCRRCLKNPPNLTAVRSWAAFAGPIRNVIHRIKYQRDLGLAEMISRQLGSYLFELGWDMDIIVPVPLSKQRYKERGYNQSALLARPIAWRCGISYRPNALRRTRDTSSQVGLDVFHRQVNVADAFVASRRHIQGKKILLVDDVATSGATMNACADACWKERAQRIYGLTVARAVQST